MRRIAILLALAACNASTGTLTLDLAVAPGSDLLANIDRLRLTLTNPAAAFEATRTANGLDLAFEIEAVQSDGLMYVEAFDANDALFAVGQSPPFPLAGSDGNVVIYVAPPYSILQAPSDLLPARMRVSGASVIYGAVLAGGVEASGAPSTSMAIYNIYDHTISYGENIPVARGGVTLAANDTAGVYVLGGTDENSAPTSNLYRFQTNIAPRGVYSDLGVHPGLESSQQSAIKLGPDLFFVTGPQPALIEESTITPVTGLADVSARATAVTTGTGETLVAFLRESAVVFYAADGELVEVTLPTMDAELERALVVGPTPGTVVVLGGNTRDLYVVDLAARTAVLSPNVLSSARRFPTVAITSRHILVANGYDEQSELLANADILDATTLELLRTVPLARRTNTVALAMSNDQILITGGEASGEPPTGLVELFTPPIDPTPP
jgi:hypothetical protein